MSNWLKKKDEDYETMLIKNVIIRKKDSAVEDKHIYPL